MTMVKQDEQDQPNQAVLYPPSAPPGRQQADVGERDWSDEEVTVGNYRLVRRVGGGGFGSVYKAEHVTLKNAFAVKLLLPKWANDETFYERFQQEALVMAELRHENVVQVIDFGVSEQLGPYLIIEWLEGKSLYRLWRLNRNLHWGWILGMFAQLLDALSYAHDRGIVHRDLKPENVVLTIGSRSRLLIKIVDFGIAKMVGSHLQTKGGDDTLSKRGAAIGTPYYMSPEQVRGEMDRIDHRTDLYACGVMLAEMLTGHRVFEGGSNRETMRLQLEAIPPTLAELNPDREYPPELEALIAKALAKDPEDRFEDAQAFYEALEHAMEAINVEPIEEDIYHDTGEATGMFPMPKRHVIEYKMLKPAVPPPRPMRAMMIGLLVACVFLGCGAVVFSMMLPKPPTKKPKPRVASTWGVPDPRPQVQTIPVQVDPDDKEDKDPDSSKQDPPRNRKRSNRRRLRRRRRRARRRRRRRRRRRQRRRRRAVPVERRKAPVERRVAPAERRKAPVERRIAPVKRKAPTVSYRIVTTPPGASVFVDGRRRGKTPLTIRGKKGKRVQIEIKKKGYVSRAYLWRFSKKSKNTFRLIEELF